MNTSVEPMYLVEGVLRTAADLSDKELMYQYFILKRGDDYIKQLTDGHWPHAEAVARLKSEISERKLTNQLAATIALLSDLEIISIDRESGSTTLMRCATTPELWVAFNIAMAKDDEDKAMQICLYLQYRGGTFGYAESCVVNSRRTPNSL